MQQTTTTVVRVFGIAVMRKESVTPISEANFKAMLEKTLEKGIDTPVRIKNKLLVRDYVHAKDLQAWMEIQPNPLP